MNLLVDVKSYPDGVLLSYNSSGDVSNVVKYVQTHTYKKSNNEQLAKILSKKGLQTKEIEEIQDFIAFKLSQHKK